MELSIGAVPCFFARAYDFQGRHNGTLLSFLNNNTWKPKSVYVTDLTLANLDVATGCVVAASKGAEVIAVDHHRPIDQQTAREYDARVNEMREAGVICRVTNRADSPACALLIESPEAQLSEEQGRKVLILSDEDADGIYCALKLCGLRYEGMDRDITLFDSGAMTTTAGQREHFDQLTWTGRLFFRARSALPIFDTDNPNVYRTAWCRLTRAFVAHVQGNKKGTEQLQESEKAYEKTVHRAYAIPVELMYNGCVAVADLTSYPNERVDMPILETRMAAGGAEVLVQIRGNGIITTASTSKKQFRVYVNKSVRERVNLYEAVEDVKERGAEHGIITNQPHLIHVSEQLWLSHVKPWLERLYVK